MYPDTIQMLSMWNEVKMLPFHQNILLNCCILYILYGAASQAESLFKDAQAMCASQLLFHEQSGGYVGITSGFFFCFFFLLQFCLKALASVSVYWILISLWTWGVIIRLSKTSIRKTFVLLQPVLTHNSSHWEAQSGPLSVTSKSR